MAISTGKTLADEERLAQDLGLLPALGDGMFEPSRLPRGVREHMESRTLPVELEFSASCPTRGRPGPDAGGYFRDL
jgi:hypothetical protein